MEHSSDPFNHSQRLRRSRRSTRHLYSVEHTEHPSTSALSPLKRKRSSSPTQELSDERMGATTCPICPEACENTGDHRIASLACGHLFGEKCLRRWLNAARSCCPTCQTECGAEDIRTIYASHVVVLDRTERRLRKVIRILRHRVAVLEQQMGNR